MSTTGLRIPITLLALLTLCSVSGRSTSDPAPDTTGRSIYVTETVGPASTEPVHDLRFILTKHKPKEVDSFVQVWTDPNMSMDLASIRAASTSANWRSLIQVRDSLKNLSNTSIWQQLVLFNNRDQEALLYFSLPACDTVMTYQTLGPLEERTEVSGNRFPNRGPIFSGTHSILIRIPAGASDTIFIRTAVGPRGYYPYFGLHGALSVTGRMAQANYWQGLFAGLVLLLIVYNLVLYFTMRDLSYLAFIVFLLGLLIYYGVVRDVVGVVLFQGNTFSINLLISLGVLLMVWGSFGLMRYYITPQRHFPRLYRLLLAFALACSVLQVATATLPSILYRPLNMVTDSVIMAYILLSAFLQVRIAARGSIQARLFLLSTLPYLIAVLYQTYVLLLARPRSSDSEYNVTQSAMAFQVILFSVAVGYRIRTIRRDKELAQAAALQASMENERIITEHNRTLEEKVSQRTIELSHRNADLDLARQRSDELLLNILPQEVMLELKERGFAEAKQHDNVTILFTDFKGFTEASEKLSPHALVEELNICFKAFDDIITKYGIEKIKTIGDAYMCAGGLPEPKVSSPIDVVHAALEMQAFISEREHLRHGQGLQAFAMRLGIHTGPVVAGIVGVKKFQYDIWGDTVNTASRMESSGMEGRVNISESTYGLVKDETGLSFTSRGKVVVKGKGELEMYFVRSNFHSGSHAVDPEQ